MTNCPGWGLTSRSIFSVVAIAAGSAIVACADRVDIASDQQKTTVDGGSTGGAGPGTGGAPSETGGVPGSGGNPATGGAGSDPSETCFSPANSNRVFAPGAVGCPCGPGDTDGCYRDLSFWCMNGRWMVFADGHDFCNPTPQAPVACSAAPDPGLCLAIFNRFYFEPASKTCKPFVYGGCEGNANNYVSLEDCEETCTKGDDPVAVIPAPSCEGYGEQVSGPGTPEFTTEGFTVSRSESWGCGCATRAEFVMTYSINAEQKIELRLCHDDSADSCEAFCTQTLSYDLSGLPPTIAADFVFPAP